ncbi:MAG TPA: DUF2330 domain-containing protein [Polyangia bacterium]|nr:DUF2330 domain-containing protein [Polyangia bacterium]
MTKTRGWKVLGALGGVALGFSLGGIERASACGCLTPPDPSVPVVQAGERIVFAMADGNVTAHIQLQYSGPAPDFGWLLPLPSQPTLELGTDELFNQLITATQPKYKLTRVYAGSCSFGGGFRGGFAGAPSAANSPGGGEDASMGPSPLVIQSSIGPYDYAVLKADSKDAMLKWLADNHYFVPVGTDDSVAPYIRPNAFFLALKLHSGANAGDLQPVVVKYPSDLPMIPIVLTSTGASQNMGIQVWMLGAGRAIPRNYYHTVLNDALLDWNNGAQNYNDVIIKAVGEANGKHSFVTEYAGVSSVLKGVLNAPNRFGNLAELSSSPDAITFVDYLNQHGFTYTSQLVGVLAHYIPVPVALTAQNITPAQFYQNISYWLGSYRNANQSQFLNYTMNYQPQMMASDIDMRVIQPTLAAGALFDQYPYLTRLYTTISPADMNKDPVFSFNPSLPNWSNVHDGTLTYNCGFFSHSGVNDTPATLVTADGWRVQYPGGVPSTFTPPPLPGSARIEILSEEGPPVVVTDNTHVIGDGLGQGCSAALGGRAPTGGFAALFLVGALALLLRRRRAA